MTNIIRSTISVFSGKVVITSIGFIFTPILVRLISQEQYGTYVTIIASFSVITLISRGGIFDATRKIVAENQTRHQQSKVVSTALILSLTYACISLLVIFIIFQMGIVPDQYSTYVPTLTIGLIFINIFSVIRGSFYGLHTEYTTELLGIIRKGSYAILAIGLLLLDDNLLNVFSGYSSSFAIASVVGFYVLINKFELKIVSRKIFIDYGSKAFKYGLTQLAGGLSALLLYQADILLIEYFQNSVDTAIYKAAILPAEYVWLIPSVIQTVFLQRTADLWSQKDVSAINDQLATGLKYTILSLSLFGIGLFPLSTTFLGNYFGEQYVQGSIVLQILLCGTILFGISRVMIPVFQATGWVKYTESMTFVTLILNISLNIILIPKYGIIGAAFGTSISYSFMLIWSCILLSRSRFRFPNYKLVIKWIIPQAVYGIIYISIVQLIHIYNITRLIVFPIVGLLIFIFMNQLFGNINLKDSKESIYDLL